MMLSFHRACSTGMASDHAKIDWCKLTPFTFLVFLATTNHLKIQAGQWIETYHPENQAPYS